MQPETKNCQNCKKDFTIDSEDFNFYEKIKVPPPTFCSECRMIRRMVWRNVRSLYKRNCGLCDKSLVSMYSDKDTAPVYCTECWYGDKWSPFSYGKDYDFLKPFFEQLRDLFNKAPRFYVYHMGNLIRSDFTNFSIDNKDCYLTYSAVGNENIRYSEIIDKSKNSSDCYSVQKVENCSYNIDCEANYNTHYAVKSRNCVDSHFIFDCVNCQNCCLSSNLRNQNYVFKNNKLTKEEYREAIEKLNLKTYSGFQNVQNLFDEMLKNRAIHRFAQVYNSHNAKGDYVGNSKNISNSFDIQNCENISYSVRVLGGAKDSYDNQGGAAGELIYESMAASFTTYKDYFCYITLGCRECEYSFICRNCSNCFGCVGMTNSKFCIFNKQYTEKEYFEMVRKIKQHMDELVYVDKQGRIFKYGEFFPFDISPFGYNETSANDFFTITKEEARAKGYPWKDKEKRDYEITKKPEDLPDSILDVKEDILNEVISCPNNGNQMFQCTTAFKIIPDELQFYRQHNFPLPRYCPNCRHYQRLKYRNTMRLYERKCMNEGCHNTFQTTYSPDRTEIIFCESCYNKEIY